MTDNITPQAQAKAPMTTSDIIRWLERVYDDRSYLARHAELDSPYDKEVEALSAAIQAVEALEEIKQELRGDCVACKSRDVQGTQEPCASCFAKSEYWEFRWPLGEEADHEHG